MVAFRIIYRMNRQIAYFRRVREDASYRSEQLVNLVYMRNFIVGLLALSMACESAYWLYRGLHQGGWMPGTSALLNLVLLGWLLSHHNQRIAVLRALEPKEIQQPYPATNTAQAAAG